MIEHDEFATRVVPFAGRRHFIRELDLEPLLAAHARLRGMCNRLEGCADALPGRLHSADANAICYDLRFPELYRALSRQGADLLLVHSAFTHTTGAAHWEVLLRARAIENLAWVVAPAQGGTHENGRRTWGQSLIVDPWGTVVAQQASEEGVVLFDIDTAQVERARTQLPALSHRIL